MIMKRFNFPSSPARAEQVLIAGNTRITVLTSRLLRLETGDFTDLPTQTVWNRDLGEVSYQTDILSNRLQITTDRIRFLIDIHKGRMISVTLEDGSSVTEFEKENLWGTARTLDAINGKTRLNPGILSRSGVSMMNDSASLLLESEGSILSRKSCTDLYYFAYGHDYLGCLKDFFALTGKVPLIPKFALGNWWSRYKAYTQQEYQELMEEFIRRNIPITVATIDMDWHWTDVVDRFGEDARPQSSCSAKDSFYNRFMPGWTGYSWNTELFPDHKALLQWLHDKGFRVTLNTHPAQGVRFFEDCYEEMCRCMGTDSATKAQIRFDIANPKFTKAYFDAVHHPLEEEGVDFWWLDWQQGTNTGIEGLDPLWALNHYHTLDSARDGRKPLILSRYAGLGSHRYPLGFSGDTICTWKSLDFQPYFTNTASNAGYTWWSHDIGGHMQGYQDDELYLRWLQYGVFSPINRLHSSNSDFMGKEPWKRSSAVQTVAEDFLRLRHKLIPYLYSANYRTHTDGIPICMPMYYRYDTQEAYQVPNQYIFGEKLLVCPITKPADKRINLASVRAWLPEGRWTDIFNGRIYRGGQWVDLHRDLDSIPVLAGEGAIVPMYENADSNDLSLDQPLQIHVWRGRGEYTLYDDDGHNDAAYALTFMEVNEENDTLRFTIHAPKGDRSLVLGRKMQICFRDIISADVTVNGEKADHENGEYVSVCMTCGDSDSIIELHNCDVLQNLPKKELMIRLLTRVQGSNARKGMLFPTDKNPSKKLPRYLRNAAAELDALL